MGNIGGNFYPQAVGGSGFTVKPDALLLAYRLLDARFLLIVTRYGVAAIDDHRTGIAVHKYRLIAPLQQAFTVDANQRWNIEGTREDHGMRGGAATFQQQSFKLRFIEFKKLTGSQIVSKADARLRQLAVSRETRFTIDML